MSDQQHSQPGWSRDARWLKDAGYVAIGLGVITFQRAQVRRRALEKQLHEAGPEVGRLLSTVDDVRKLVEERLGAIPAQLESTIDEVRGHIPDQALEVLDTAMGVAREATGQLLDLVRPHTAA